MSSIFEVASELRQSGKKVALLPLKSPSVAVYGDVSKRVSTCQLCSTPIKKKSKRIVMLVRTMGRRFPSGGFKSMDKFFLHYGCLIPVLNGKSMAAGLECWDCSSRLLSDSSSPTIGQRLAVAGGRTSFLCDSCSSSDRYTYCWLCKLLASKRDISRVLPDPNDEWAAQYAGHFICDNCARNSGLLTCKTQACIDRREEVFKARYDRLVEKLKAGKGFE